MSVIVEHFVVEFVGGNFVERIVSNFFSKDFIFQDVGDECKDFQQKCL